MAITAPPVVDEFANTVAGTPSDLWDVPTYLDSGFPAPSGVPVRPPLGFFNWLFWFCVKAARYLMSRGIPEWISTETEYTVGSTVIDPADGHTYQLFGTATTGTAPHLDLTNWVLSVHGARAVPGSWAQKIWQWLDEQGRARFTVDHFGMPKWAGCDWTETWAPGLPFQLSGVQNVDLGRWTVVMNAAQCGTQSKLPGVASGLNFLNTSRAVQMVVDGGSAGNRSELRVSNDAVTSLIHDDAIIRVGAWLNPFVTVGMNWVFGLTSNGEFVNGINDGIFFITQHTGNYFAVTGNGGSPTAVDTGIAGTADAPHFLEIVFLGANVAGTARALFLVDGVLKANITATLPIGQLAIPVVGGFAQSTTPNGAIEIGPVQYAQIIVPATL